MQMTEESRANFFWQLDVCAPKDVQDGYVVLKLFYFVRSSLRNLEAYINLKVLKSQYRIDFLGLERLQQIKHMSGMSNELSGKYSNS